ncbi:MAG TPA: MFS transporter [Gaiellaceae bacterium]|nr:MFS transporter [Gaiellaceae bacterium]
MRSPLWRDRGFVDLWAANGISQLGEQVSILAIPLTALFVLKRGALEVALLRAFSAVPFLLFSLPAGVWIDRMRRRPLMIAADVGRALSLATIPIAYWLGDLTLVQLYVVAVIHGTLTVVFDVSYLSFLPGLVSRERLNEANAKLLGTQAVAQVIGPTLAGALIGAVGAAVAVVANSVTYAASGAFVLHIRGREEMPEPARTRKRDELLEGIRYVFGQPNLRTLTVWTSLWNLFTSGFFAIEVVYFVRTLHWSATKIGIVLALASSGLLLGAAVNERLARRFGLGRMIAYSGVVYSALTAAVPGAPRAHAALVIVVTGFVASTVGFFANVNQLTYRQAITPTRLLGRMNSIVRLMYWGTIPAGSALAGVVAGPLGLRTTLIATAIGATVACIPIMVSPIRGATVPSDARVPGDGGVAAPAS